MTRGTLSPSKIGKRRSSGVRRVNISVSLRGVAWQNSTSPNPRTSTRSVCGQPASNRFCSGLSSSATQRTTSRICSGTVPLSMPAICSSTARSPLPWINRTGTLRSIKHVSVSRGIGPGSTSPPTTTRSTPAWLMSWSTASSAGRFA